MLRGVLPKQILVPLVGGLAAAALFAAMTAGFGFERSTAQYLFFPLIVWLVSCLDIAGRRVPLGLLAAAVVLAAGAFTIQRSNFGGETFRVPVARFINDDLGARTRVFRMQLEGWLERNHVEHVDLSDYYRAVENVADARRVVRENSGQPFLVWGNLHWLNVTFGDLVTSELREFSEGGLFLSYPDLLLISDLPGIGMSLVPEQGSAHFLGGLITAKLISPELQLNRAVRETFFRDIGGLVEGWSGFAHRAYPYFLAGNQHFHELLQARLFQPSEFECARRSYLRALEFLGGNEHPTLRAAVFNNLALLSFTHWELSGRKQDKRLVKKYLKIARSELPRITRSTAVFQSPLAAYAARLNFYLTASSIGSPKLRRKLGMGLVPSSKKRGGKSAKSLKKLHRHGQKTGRKADGGRKQARQLQ